MATVNLGRIKPVWQGTWNSSTQYTADDIVYYNNSAWVAVATSTNSAPADGNANWDKMAQGSDIPAGDSNGQVLTADGSGNYSWTTPVEGKLKKVSKYTYTSTTQSNPGAFVWINGPTWTHTLDDSSNTLVLWGNFHVASRYNNAAMRVQYSTDGGSNWTEFAGPTRSGWGSSPLHANIYTGDSPFIPSFSWMDTLAPGVNSVQIRVQLSPDSSSWVAFNTRDGNTGNNATGGPTQLTIMEYAA